MTGRRPAGSSSFGWALFLLVAFIGAAARVVVVAESSSSSSRRIVVFGSINADTFLPVTRLPTEGENLTTDAEPVTDVPGGKGCTQAVAVSKLLTAAAGTAAVFVGQLGNDGAAAILEQALEEAGVDTSHCGHHRDLASGRGYVFLSTRSGQVSAVVSGGSNTAGWDEWKSVLDSDDDDADHVSRRKKVERKLDAILEGCQCVLLQREVPEFVNLLVARICRQRGITVIQDVGGEDRPISREMLNLCDYIMPNENELERLVRSLELSSPMTEASALPSSIVDLARLLQKHGARNVLVTQGSRGSTLVGEQQSDGFEERVVLHQPACPVLRVVDETGAGDCYRAGFAVALQENQPLQQCMRFASAAGACSVTKQGAVPSTPTRHEAEERMQQSSQQQQQQQQHHLSAQDSVLSIPRGDGLFSGARGGGYEDKNFPFLIGSRLNSMKDRPELWSGSTSLLTPKDFVQRQATIAGLTCVDFNYPQHFHTWSSEEAKAALDEAGLVAGAVCLRYPTKFARGAMNHPDAGLRREAIQLTKEAAQVAIELGCKEVVVWSAFDGYDYPFQVEYDTKWQELVEAFQECCDAFPEIKFSLEVRLLACWLEFTAACSTFCDDTRSPPLCRYLLSTNPQTKTRASSLSRVRVLPFCS